LYTTIYTVIEDPMSVIFSTDKYRSCLGHHSLSFTVLFLLSLIISARPAIAQEETSNDNESLESLIYSFPISGEIRDAFTNRPVTGAIARFIILPDSISFQTDHLGYFNGKWKSVEEAVVTNYPNPFNPSTTIQFPAAYDILDIYNILGQRLAHVDLHSETQIELEMASGVYLYRLRDNETGKVAQNKMIALDGGFFTIHFEKIDRSQRRPTNMFNRANSNFDDFSEVKIVREGYAELDTNVRIIEGVRNNFLFHIKPYKTFVLQGHIRDNYGHVIYDSRLLLIHNPLTEPDTIYNQIVTSSFKTPNIVRTAMTLEDVMIKVIRYGHDTHVEYITLVPGINNKEIELAKPLNDYLLYGYVTDYMTTDNLNKKLIIRDSETIIDTVMSVNGEYEFSFADTANALNLTIEFPEDKDYKGTSTKITAFPRNPARADLELRPFRIRYYVEGTVTDLETKEPVAGAWIYAMHGDDTLGVAVTNNLGKYKTTNFYDANPQIRGVRLQIIAKHYDDFRQYLTLHIGQNTIDRAIKP
jgi:hypothetical protein